MINTEDIGERLEKIADRFFDGNKAKLARFLGKEPNSFYKYFRGERTPGLEIVAQLGKLGVNEHWFITGRGEMETSTVVVDDSNLANELAAEVAADEEKDYFAVFNQADLSDTEARILAEVKHFSAFLETRPLRPQIKRLLIQLLIQSIDQALEQRRDSENS